MFFKNSKVGKLVFSLIACISAQSQAGSPVWTIIPLTPTSISVPSNSTATVQYRITNQSPAPHSLVMVPTTGITQTITAGNCPNPFTLTSSNPSCTLTLQVTGNALNADIHGGPKICQQGPDGNPSPLQCYQPSQSNGLNIIAAPPVNLSTTISASVNTLALKTSGNPRKITLTNTGTSTASSVTYSPSPALPSGTTITPANCGNIAPLGTCILTIAPGATPSAIAYNTSPTPITLSIQGINTNTLTPTLNILTFGSVYQSGYIYSIDDATPTTNSIGGKVATLTNQAAAFPSGIIWSSDGAGSVASNVSSDIIPLIAELSTVSTNYSNANVAFISNYSNAGTNPFPASSLFLTCSGATDGQCNTANILTLYKTYVTHYSTTKLLSPEPTNPSFYAAGLCKANIGGYADWYLPAICEMGPTIGGSGCVPSTPNMVTNLPSLLSSSCTGTSCLTSFYWSSTESSSSPAISAWFQSFAPSGGSASSQGSKVGRLNVRCSRALTL